MKGDNMKLNEEQRQLVEDNIGIIYNTIKLTNGNIHNIDLKELFEITK